MFRLIQLHAHHGIPRIDVDPDGYASERAALARYRATPATFFGVGRFDHEGTLAEVIMDTVCGPIGDCPRPASVVHAETFQRLCDTCAFGLDVLTVASWRCGSASRCGSRRCWPAPAGTPRRSSPAPPATGSPGSSPRTSTIRLGGWSCAPSSPGTRAPSTAC